jgi:heat shock protein HslJ
MAVVGVLGFGCAKKNSNAPPRYTTTTSTAPGDSLARGPWRWIATVTASSRTVCTHPDVYTITFLPDSTVRLVIDCNRGSGPYHSTGHSIHIGPFAATRMLCPPGSMDTTFVAQLGRANAWHIDADTLQLDTMGRSQMQLVR